MSLYIIHSNLIYWIRTIIEATQKVKCSSIVTAACTWASGDVNICIIQLYRALLLSATMGAKLDQFPCRTAVIGYVGNRCCSTDKSEQEVRAYLCNGIIDSETIWFAPHNTFVVNIFGSMWTDTGIYRIIN